MKRWAVIVAVLYALMLGVLSLPVVLAAFAPLTKDRFPDAGGEGLEAAKHIAASLYGAWQWWLWLVVMGLAQAAMLAVPVRLGSRRPMTRLPLALTVLTGALDDGRIGHWGDLFPL
jgi:hypothetical protein